MKSQCADKYEMRSFVLQRGFGHLLPQLLGVYESPVEIDFDFLPERFVLKCTHGCGYNIICRDKHSLDREETCRKLDSWLKIEVSKLGGEVHYARIRPRIIAEVFLDDSTGDLPSDYKLYCFDGTVHCTLVCTERGAGQPNFDIYDREWSSKLPYSKSSLCADRIIAKPAAYEEMLEAAEALSKPFPFVRMDFYSINGNAVIGEMTFTPRGCIDTGYTDLAQRELGALVRLPERRLE